ncbi:hypothetical protein CYMTET_33333, partial [Cymbomonas tetramitiformis]
GSLARVTDAIADRDAQRTSSLAVLNGQREAVMCALSQIQWTVANSPAAADSLELALAAVYKAHPPLQGRGASRTVLGAQNGTHVDSARWGQISQDVIPKLVTSISATDAAVTALRDALHQERHAFSV